MNEDIDAIYHDIDINYDNNITWDEYMMNTFGFYEKGITKKCQIKRFQTFYAKA